MYIIKSKLHVIYPVLCPLLMCFYILQTLVNVFITSWIDYCNSVFSRIAGTRPHPLQSALNEAVRLIVKKCKYDLITATLRDVLHWLPIQQRIEHKLCDLVCKAMHHTASLYLIELCSCVNTLNSTWRLECSSEQRHNLWLPEFCCIRFHSMEHAIAVDPWTIS